LSTVKGDANCFAAVATFFHVDQNKKGAFWLMPECPSVVPSGQFKIIYCLFCAYFHSKQKRTDLISQTCPSVVPFGQFNVFFLQRSYHAL